MWVDSHLRQHVPQFLVASPLTKHVTSIAQIIDRFAYLSRSIGTWGMLRRVFAQLLAPLVKIDRCFVWMLFFRSGVDTSTEQHTDDAGATQSFVVETVGDLEASRHEMDRHCDFVDSRDFLRACSPNRFLVLSRRQHDDGSNQIIAVRRCERGVLFVWNGRVVLTLPRNYVMVHTVEVHPEYRGQRVTLQNRLGLYDYAMQNGIDRAVGIIKAHNPSSIKAHTRPTEIGWPRLRGEIRRVRLLGGLVEWTTPLGTIRALVEAPPDHSE